MSHVGRVEITKFEVYLTSIYLRLTVHRVKVHEYWGMDLDYRKQITVNISIIKYLGSVVKYLPDRLGTTTATLESDHFFKLRYES